MSRIKVAIACQRGGSQTAFTAGALKGLLESEAPEEFEVVGVSGTSGGAVCAALAWYALRKGNQPIWGPLIEFWHDNIAHGWSEETFNEFVVNAMRMANKGLFPVLQLSPSSPLVHTLMSFMTLGSRRSFTDFPDLLRKYIDFEEIARWGPSLQGPVLFVGTANVTTGTSAEFVSAVEPMRLEHILPSCAVPNIFAAVDIDGEAYWDGLFSDNPPIEELVRPRSVGLENVPEEIWLIKINPTARKRVPLDPDDIVDRRNQLEGNISLFHQLDHLEMINDLILDGAFKPQFLKQLDVKAAIRIPRSFDTDPDKPYHIPCIEMPPEVQDTLDYEGKIDRSARNIEWLLAQGESAAKDFLTQRAAVVAAHPMPAMGSTHLLEARSSKTGKRGRNPRK